MFMINWKMVIVVSTSKERADGADSTDLLQTGMR